MLDLLIIPHPLLQEAYCDLRLFFYSTGCEQVGIRWLVVRILEVVDFDPSAVNQGLQAVIGFAQAHSKLLREFALGDRGVFLDAAEDF